VASFVDQYGFLATWLSCYQLLVFLFEPNKFLLLLLRICLTRYDVINFNDITSALNSYAYGRNLTFTGV